MHGCSNSVVKVAEITSVSLIASPLMTISLYDDQKNLFNWEIINRVIIMVCRYVQVGPKGCFLSLIPKKMSLPGCDYNQEMALSMKGDRETR